MQCDSQTNDCGSCMLAKTTECAYCSVLRGEAVCDCDWRGWCAYERYQWRDASVLPAGAVVGVRAHGVATGLIVNGNEQFAGAPVGTIFALTLPPPAGQRLRGIVLRVFPSGLVFLLSFDPVPAAALGQTAAIIPAGNAFAGAQALTAPGGKRIAIMAAEPLAGLLAPLTAGLRSQGALVEVLPPGGLNAGDAPDIVFAAGGENEIKRVATGLPPSFRGQIVTWTTSGLWPQ